MYTCTSITQQGQGSQLIMIPNREIRYKSHDSVLRCTVFDEKDQGLYSTDGPKIVRLES